MNEQHISKTPELPVKRKRGRPRKDETMPRPHPPPPPAAIHPPLTPVDHSMVGQAVTCIIDGIFDNGYLISTRLGPNNAILRGIVFQQGHVAPVTPENDVAPHLKMCTRTEFPVPPANPRNPDHQTVEVQNYQNAPPQVESLRLVEQDDVMQVFEVSKVSQEPKDCDRNEFEGKESVIEIPEQHGNQCVKEQQELLTENQQSLDKDQESKQQTGEVNNIDTNQGGEVHNVDANQAVAVDLSLRNFSEI